MTKLVYIISDIDKAVAFEWIARWLDQERYQLSFVILNPRTSHLEGFLRERGIPVKPILCRGKKDWPSAWWQLYRYLRQERPGIVHCHLLQANILGLSAARAAGVPKRIYTRHHSSLHHVFHPKGVFWDKRANRQATDIVAISENVKHILIEWEKAPASKVHVIPHGFLLDSFRQVPQERRDAIRTKYSLDGKRPVIGVISRFTEFKGVHYIVPAFQEVLAQLPDAVLLLFNAAGDYADKIRAQLALLPEDSYRAIPFESDIAAAMHAMDIFVHVPIDEHSEAFGQTYVEVLAAQVPSVFTMSGIAPDFVRHQENAWVVPFRDSNAIAAAIRALWSDPALREKIAAEGWKSVQKEFALSKMISNLEHLYEK